MHYNRRWPTADAGFLHPMKTHDGIKEGFANEVLNDSALKTLGLKATAMIAVIHGNFDASEPIIASSHLPDFMRMMNEKYKDAGQGYEPKFLAKVRRNVFVDPSADTLICVGQ